MHCKRPGQTEIWKLAEEFWAKKHPTWPPLSLGNILGSGLTVFTDEKKRVVVRTATPPTCRDFSVIPAHYVEVISLAEINLVSF
jgi:hypothetical protein